MNIEEKRREIDDLDIAKVSLLNKRAEIVMDISAIKQNAGLAVRDMRREDELLRRLKVANSGAMDDAAIERIYRKILAESRRTQTMARKVSESRTEYRGIL